MKKVYIVKLPGTNCEVETKRAFELLGCNVEYIDANYTKNLECDLVVIPGGFSYGDALRSGSLAVKKPVIQNIIKYSKKGGLILGICNGFQILTESKLLNGTLIKNKNSKFISKKQRLQIVNQDNRLFTNIKKEDTLDIPIAHINGNYQVDQKELEKMYSNGQVLLKYKYDINGSIDSIAGICNSEKNVFGVMPHFERATGGVLYSDDGIKILKGLIE